MPDLDQLKRTVEQMNESELRTLMLHFMIHMQMAQEQDILKEQLYDRMLNIYEAVLNTQNQQIAQRRSWMPDENTKNIHIVFDASAAGSVKQMIREHGSRDIDRILQFDEVFSIGPIWRLAEEQGKEHRRAWFRQHLDPKFENVGDGHYPSIESLPADAAIYIWCSNNAHEQTGLRFVSWLLKDRSNHLYILDAPAANEQKEDQPGVLQFYSHTGEIPSRDLSRVYQDPSKHVLVTAEQRRSYEQEWQSLSESTNVLRIWAFGELISVEVTYFDDFILEKVRILEEDKPNGEFLKAARVIGEVIGHSGQYTGDAFIEYRLRELIYSGKLEIQGVPRAMRYYSVRSKGT
ncbi:DUF1835 domain-containing protein [Paenibacillus sp. PDC88]|uniref:DUF1835 domain-containing protein n=1 Tax=Paenibacillus sp. PDC88 TaxID=1884375 RepID=UPI0008981918|nr:DUF1835 domain-containing protein [Paenibacillus sp. PDC88]SDX58758.1 protein of unknown function [Paenibacillus sp. PDC88]